MKKLYLLVTFLLVTILSFGQSVFINEIHYDNASTDEGEAIEIAGPASTDLTGYSVIGYNGNNGEEYANIALTGTIPDQDDGYGTLFFMFTGMQNGAPDGLALVDASSNLIQFLSYEGSFTAVGGPADGVTSTDIGVAEIGTPIGESLQLSGSGTEYSNFTWQESMVNTMGAVNTNQDFGGTPQPGLTINAPSDGSVLNPEMTDVDVTFTVTNFIVANGTGDGHIHYTVDGGSVVMKYDTDPISLTGLTSSSHTVYMELVDNSHNPLNPPVNDQVTFEIASYTDVANLVALRAGTVGEYYRVTGEVIGTFAQSYRNQKWVQDATAGMKIDDNDGVITTIYNEGDGVVNLRGKLAVYNQVLQLVPTADLGAPNSTGNVINPEVITLLDLTGTKALADYESELIQILNVTISDYDDGGAGTANGTFQGGENYPIDDGTATSFLRTDFFDADYVVNNEVLPTAPIDIVCIVGGYNGEPQITPRDFYDFLGVNQETTISGFSLYPNPIKNGTINITTDSNLSKNIQIFDMLGKEVLSIVLDNTKLNISNLNAGVYIIKVEEAGRTATQKLVIE